MRLFAQLRRKPVPSSRETAVRYTCRVCENDVWRSNGALFRLHPSNGRIAVAEQLSTKAPVDLLFVQCNGCDFIFHCSECASDQLHESPLSAYPLFESRDAIHDVRGARKRLELLSEMLAPSDRRILRHIARAHSALEAAERAIIEEWGDAMYDVEGEMV